MGVAALLAGSASAAPPANGSWNITGIESYANQVLVMGNITDIDGNATDNGNITVTASGDLTFNNVTLVLPFASTFDVQGRAVFRNSTITGSYWKLWLRGTVELTDNHFVNNSFSGTIIETTAVVVERNTWNCSDYGGNVRIRRAFDFRNQTLEAGCGIIVEMPSLTVNKDIEYSNLVIRNTGGATGITVADTFHTGRVNFDYHALTINGTGGGWGIQIGATSSTTSYRIHDSTISETGSAAIRCDSYDGGLAIYNITFTNVLRAARMDGLPGGTVAATIDNITTTGTTDSIYGTEMTWVIRNSTIGGVSPQFDAGTNGHIKIYDSSDTAFAASNPSTGGSIEHFIRLEMGVPRWQNNIAITDDFVTLLDANNVPSILVNASTWTPREIVWWAMYPQNVRVDNRQLQPVVIDAGTTLNCTPSSFLVSPGMALQPVTCTDDSLPVLTFIVPTYPRIQNSSLVSGSARVVEAGSGLNTVEFSLDGVGFGPVTFLPNDARNFTYSRPGVADGTYTVTLRATDRTGNVRVLNGGPLLIDTVVPNLSFDAIPTFVSGSSYNVTGATEGNISVTIARAGGFSNATISRPDGTFTLGVLVEEGLNTYTITARDIAGNAYSLFASLQVDTIAPSLVVLLDGEAANTALESAPSVRVEGMTEPSAVVRVNGILPARAGASFTLDLSLTRGRTDLVVTATDAAGNVATWFGVAYYDDVAPVLSLEVNGQAVTGPTPIVTRSASASVAGTATDLTPGVATVTVGGVLATLDGSSGFSTVVALAEGSNMFTVTAADRVGNAVSITFVVVRDATAPTFALSVVADSSPVVLTQGGNSTAGATVKLVIVASENGTATFAGAPHAVQAGANEFVVPLEEGRNPFSVSFVDSAGNPAVPASLVVERKSTAPPLGVSAPLPGASVDAAAVEVVGTTDPQSTVRVNGTLVPVSATGEFRVVVPLSVGTNSIRVEVTDALGNTNATTTTVVRTAAQQPPGPINTGGGFGIESIVLLIVGLAAGIGGGLAMGKRGRAARSEADAAGATEADAPVDASQSPYDAPSEPASRGHAAGPRQRGPRGPMPPQ